MEFKFFKRILTYTSLKKPSLWVLVFLFPVLALFGEGRSFVQPINPALTFFAPLEATLGRFYLGNQQRQSDLYEASSLRYRPASISFLDSLNARLFVMQQDQFISPEKNRILSFNVSRKVAFDRSKGALESYDMSFLYGYGMQSWNVLMGFQGRYSLLDHQQSEETKYGRMVVTPGLLLKGNIVSVQALLELPVAIKNLRGDEFDMFQDRVRANIGVKYSY